MKLSYVQAHLDWSDAFVRHATQPCQGTRQNVGLPLDRSARLEVAARRSLIARATLRLTFGRRLAITLCRACWSRAHLGSHGACQTTGKRKNYLRTPRTDLDRCIRLLRRPHLLSQGHARLRRFGVASTCL